MRVPYYVVDGVLIPKIHFEGGYLFRDMVMIEAEPPATEKAGWKITYQYASQQGKAPAHATIVADDHDVLTFEIPVEQPNAPGSKARLRVETRFWNDWQA